MLTQNVGGLGIWATFPILVTIYFLWLFSALKKHNAKRALFALTIEDIRSTPRFNLIKKIGMTVRLRGSLTQPGWASRGKSIPHKIEQHSDNSSHQGHRGNRT